jgi:hypothetical protein
MMATSLEDSPTVGVRTKIVLGVVLPLIAFILGLALLFQVQGKTPDDKMAAVLKGWIVYVPGLPVIIFGNLIFLARKWRKAKEICLVGFILPAILLIIECCLIAFWKM